jgi:5-formyltetrahydrofolate cyclo-ligase
MVTKAELRAALRGVVIPDRARASAVIADRVMRHPAWRASAVAAFVGVRHEPDTGPLLRAALDEGKTVWLPKVEGRTVLSWGRVDDLDTLVAAGFGLCEPATGQARFPDVDLVLVPGIAFGRDGARLGHGRGHYDRALASTDAGPRIGLCFARFLDPPEGPIPMGPRDIYMDAVIAES